MTETTALTATPENAGAPKKPKDLNFLGRLMKLASFPLAASVAYWVMDTSARGEIMDVELKSSSALKQRHSEYIAERSRLSNAVDQGILPAAEALVARERNHAQWRRFLYENLGKKGFGSFKNKFDHLRRVDKQKLIIEGVTVGSIIIGALFSIANTDLFKSHEEKDTPER